MFEYISGIEDCVHLTPAAGIDVYACECEKMTIAVMELEANLVTGEHSHPHEQVGYMVSGEAQFVIDSRTYPVRAGQMWRLPGGVPHRVIVGDMPMRVVEVFYPVREDMRKPKN